MKIKVTLDGGAGELDHAILEASGDDFAADDFSEQIIDAIRTWTLSVGDTITIREV